MTQPIVRVNGLSKTFSLREPWPWSPARMVHAVKTMDLTVLPGEILAVVGQSGSGKTTLSRIILGLEEPSEGEIWLEAERWDHRPESFRQALRLRYQYVPQDAMSALDPQQTSLEHVIETLRALAGRDRVQALREALEMLDRLGISHRRDALPREMSGGEQRRVTLARVLALNPKLIVADEPTSGLDPERRGEVLRDLIGNLPEGAACVLVTHDMEATRDWCTRAIVMLDGHVIEEFDPRIQEPRHPYGRMLYAPWTGPLPKGELRNQGCPYDLDCILPRGELSERCRTCMPALSAPDSQGHRVACHVLAPIQADNSLPSSNANGVNS